MENLQEEYLNRKNEFIKSNRRGKIMGGLLLVVIGSLFLAKQMGAIFPIWLFSWKTLLIGMGIVTGVKHKFRHASWLVLIGIGSIFLIGDVYPDWHIQPMLWPILIIFIGLVMIFKPRRNHFHSHYYKKNWRKHQMSNWSQYQETESTTSNNEDIIDSTTIMAGIKKNIFSKSFKGGQITNIMGGTEINLMQSEIEDKAKLEITQVLGGTTLIVPANWEIKSELVTIMGGVEDKRPIQPRVSGEKSRMLLLTGTTVLGGIEITCY